MNKLLEGKGVPWVHQAILVAFLDSLFVVISYGVALILLLDFSFSSIPERLSVVYAVLDCIYYRSVLCVPALSQYMEAGKYFRIADEYCRLRSIIAGIWHRHYVYASADA